MGRRVKLNTDVKPVSEFRANAAELIEHVKTSRRPLVLTQREHSAAVLLDVAEYERMVDEIELLSDVRTRSSRSSPARGCRTAPRSPSSGDVSSGENRLVAGPGAALRWLDGLLEVTDALEAFPESGRIVPEIGLPEFREMVYRRAYRVVYRIEKSRASILTVRNFAQQLDPAELKIGDESAG